MIHHDHPLERMSKQYDFLYCECAEFVGRSDYVLDNVLRYKVNYHLYLDQSTAVGEMNGEDGDAGRAGKRDGLTLNGAEAAGHVGLARDFYSCLLSDAEG